jgi:type IV pilus assembly protein PilC
MPHFRLQATTQEGKLLQREFEAPSKKVASERVKKLAKSRSFKIRSIDEKQTYLYKVRKNGAAAIEGEQEAYSPQEVELALKKMGYRVDYVKRKWFDFKGMVPNEEVVTFIRLSADLLRQKLPYEQILTLLYEDTTNKSMKEIIRTIQKIFGKEKRDRRCMESIRRCLADLPVICWESLLPAVTWHRYSTAPPNSLSGMPISRKI